MRDTAREAAEFARRHTRAELDANRFLWLGLVKAIEIIGEAVSKVTAERRRAHPEIPWSRITGMRHRLVHDYDQIDRDAVWQTATEDLDPLLAALDRIVT
jgi:uncharacterized protein with HEPN domain